MPVRAAAATMRSMKTYAVSWWGGSHTDERHIGKLVVGASSASLEGGSNGSAASRTLPAAELADVRLDRTPAGREHGHPSILVSLRNGSLVRVVSLDQPGTGSEIVNRLTALAHGAR